MRVDEATMSEQREREERRNWVLRFRWQNVGNGRRKKTGRKDIWEQRKMTEEALEVPAEQKNDCRLKHDGTDAEGYYYSNNYLIQFVTDLPVRCKEKTRKIKKSENLGFLRFVFFQVKSVAFQVKI